MSVPNEVLAQLAAAAYRETSDENRIDPPAGWTQIAAYPDAAQTSGDAFTGFSAAAFRGPGSDTLWGDSARAGLASDANGADRGRIRASVITRQRHASGRGSAIIRTQCPANDMSAAYARAA